MPSPTEIVAGLAETAHRAFALAVIFHVLLAACAVAWLYGLRPSSRAIASSLSVPLASVALVAFWFGNPFNGFVFLLLSIVLAILAQRQRAPSERDFTAPLPLRALGVVLVLFAAIYPHFLEDRSPLSYLYGAPLGLIPCPTLGLLTGFGLLGLARSLRAWSVVLALASIFYALFGVLRLGVTLDVVLLAGALGLLLQAARRAHRRIAAQE